MRTDAWQPPSRGARARLRGDLAEYGDVKADNFVGGRGEIGLGAVGKLAWQSVANQKPVERFAAGVKCLDGMVSPQLFDAERHCLVSGLLFEYAWFV